MVRRSFQDGMPRKFLMVFVAVVVAGGVSVAYLAYQNQVQADTILQQAQDIVQKAQEISFLNSEVRQQSGEIFNLTQRVRDTERELTETLVQVNDLNGRLGVATQELSELRPKIRNYYVVGVDSQDRGVVVPIEVKLVSGSGSVSASINNVDLLSGAQDSIRTAAAVASAYTKIPISNKDITITFVHSGTDVVSVDGPSAGAAITSTIIAALTDRTPRSDVLITGTINPSWTVGQIGSAPAKAQAAKEFGAKTFLVPVADGGFGVVGLEIVTVSDIGDVVQRNLN